MKPLIPVVFISLLCACAAKKPALSKLGELHFRITYNYNYALTDKELDSLQHTKPYYSEISEDSSFYQLLVKKGFVKDEQLDTAGLQLQVLSYESPVVRLPGFECRLVNDTSVHHDFLSVKKDKEIVKTDLGANFPGERLISLFNTSDDGKPSLIMLEKYYVMGGDNFGIKFYKLE